MKAKNNALLRRLSEWLRGSFSVSRSDVRQTARDGLLRRNPLFVLLLGLCPALFVTTCLQNAVATGVATTAVLICTGLTCSLLRAAIPAPLRVAVRLVSAAAFTGAADLLMQAFFPELSQALGIYVPLIAVSGVIMSRSETFGYLPGKAFLDGLFAGLGFTAALVILGGARELLGSGSLWGHALPFISVHPLRLLLTPCGGLLSLGFLTALVQHISRRKGGAA